MDWGCVWRLEYLPFLTLLKTFFAIFSSARGFANGTRAPSSLGGGAEGFLSELMSSIGSSLSVSASGFAFAVWELAAISCRRRSALSGVTELLPLLLDFELLDLDLVMPSDECLEWDLSFFSFLVLLLLLAVVDLSLDEVVDFSFAIV